MKTTEMSSISIKAASKKKTVILVSVGLILVFLAIGINKAVRLVQSDNNISMYRTVPEANSALKRNATDTKALRTLVMHMRGNYPERIALWRNIVAIEPDNRFARFNLGCALSVSGQEKEALPIFKALSNSDDNIAFNSRRIAEGLIKRGAR